MREIKLTNGGIALVDDTDYESINHWKWRKDQHGYATRVKRTYIGKGKYKCTTIFMHRQILGTPTGKDTDHRDRNRLNNCRSNLRPATRSENNLNSKLRKDNTSGHKGIRWHTQTKKWNAAVWYKGRTYSCGLFNEIGDAIDARNKMLREIYPEFANV